MRGRRVIVLDLPLEPGSPFVRMQFKCPSDDEAVAIAQAIVGAASWRPLDGTQWTEPVADRGIVSMAAPGTTPVPVFTRPAPVPVAGDATSARSSTWGWVVGAAALVVVAVVAIVVVVALVRSGDDYPDVQAENAAAPTAVPFAEPTALLTALNDGGLTCALGTVEPRGGDEGSTQECVLLGSNDMVTAWVFPSADAARREFAEFLAVIRENGGFDLVLRGADWFLTSSVMDEEGYVTGTGYDALLQAQEIIGGQLIETGA